MRVAVICAGRGSYGRTELGSLRRLAGEDARAAAVLDLADDLRVEAGRTPLSELDAAERFSAVHLAGENAAGLIAAATFMDVATLSAQVDIVAVAGNSMGFYTALGVSGALDLADSFRLADGMGAMQRNGVVGGQVIYPLVNDEWQQDPLRCAAVEQALQTVRAEGLRADWSIRLGGQSVLAGEDAAVKRLLALLPPCKLGSRDYPFQLLGHSAFHTALMESTSAQAQQSFEALPFRAPRIPLLDGRGVVFSPLSAAPASLRAYTLGHQVLCAYDFTASIRVLLREFAPQALVLPGPGESLGGALAQILIAEGWQGLHSREDFVKRQQSAEPVLISMARQDQRALLSLG
jgi:acyl transferase domain-containing protein